MSGIVVQDMGLVVQGSDRFASKVITFTGAAGAGATGTAVQVFKVTGQVLVRFLSGFCIIGLGEAAGTATISLGVVGATALFIGSMNSVDVDTGEFWVSTTPTAAGIALPAAMKDIIIGANIVLTPATQNTNAGQVRFSCIWRPLSPDGFLEPA